MNHTRSKNLKGNVCKENMEIGKQFMSGSLYFDTFLCVWSSSLNELSALNREIVAERMGISKSHLSNQIRQHHNMSFFEILEFVRILKAAELMLKKSELKIREIARLVGIRKDEHFRKKFKKYFGVAPSEYREHRMISQQEGVSR